MADEQDFVKVHFPLEPDADGYPPAETEGLWAVHVRNSAYRIDNTPWFVFNVAADDIFLAEPDGDGVLWATERVRWSGNCTIRVVPLDCTQQAVLDELVPLGAHGEGFGPGMNIVALTIPPGVDLARVKDRLRQGEEAGKWAYEEGCVGGEWASA